MGCGSWSSATAQRRTFLGLAGGYRRRAGAVNFTRHHLLQTHSFDLCCGDVFDRSKLASSHGAGSSGDGGELHLGDLSARSDQPASRGAGHRSFLCPDLAHLRGKSDS